MQAPKQETFTDEEELLYLAGRDKDIYALVHQYISEEDLTNPFNITYYKGIGKIVESGEELSEVALEAQLEDILHGLIRSVRLKSLRNQYKEHSRLADQLSRSNDPRFIEELRICQDLQELIKQWSA